MKTCPYCLSVTRLIKSPMTGQIFCIVCGSEISQDCHMSTRIYVSSSPAILKNGRINPKTAIEVHLN